MSCRSKSSAEPWRRSCRSGIGKVSVAIELSDWHRPSPPGLKKKTREEKRRRKGVREKVSGPNSIDLRPKSFLAYDLTKFLARLVESVVFFWPAFDGAWFDAAARPHRVSGQPKTAEGAR